MGLSSAENQQLNGLKECKPPPKTLWGRDPRNTALAVQKTDQRFSEEI